MPMPTATPFSAAAFIFFSHYFIFAADCFIDISASSFRRHLRQDYWSFSEITLSSLPPH
jgi:hypothetical protein